MSVFSFDAIAREMVSKGWGKQSDKIENTISSLTSGTVGDVCLVRIVNHVQKFIDAVATSGIEEQASGLRIKCEIEEEVWISEREKKHGTCPDIVRVWVRNDVNESIGSDLRYGRIRTQAPYIGTPSRTTEAGKEYRRWMKRKAKAS